MKRRIILLGPPGSGKGTIAAQLQTEFGLNHVSSGHLLRKEVEAGSAVGRRAKLFLEKGELVPDEIVLEFMRGWFLAAPMEAGFMLDGFPRTLGQARAFDDWLAQCNAPIQAVILYDCDLKTVLTRIAGRRSCPRCGRVYHLQSMPPRVAGMCDECSMELVQREDDSEHVMRRRFEIYAGQTEPLAGYYKQQGKLTIVSAVLPPEDRFAATIAALSE